MFSGISDLFLLTACLKLRCKLVQPTHFKCHILSATILQYDRNDAAGSISPYWFTVDVSDPLSIELLQWDINGYAITDLIGVRRGGDGLLEPYLVDEPDMQRLKLRRSESL
jgi:hypothetical protein